MRKALSLFTLLLATAAAQSLFAFGCSNESFNGTYGILARGAVTVPGFPVTGPFARAGRVVADGKGKVTFYTTASYNGNIFNEAIPATYSVASDCSLTFTVPPFVPIGLPATFSGFITAEGLEVEFLISNPPGQAIRATMTKQNIGPAIFGVCGDWDLFETYTLQMEGNIISGALPAGEFTRIGKFTPDGHGNFSASTIANYNGFVIQPESFKGTYNVTNTCDLTTNYTFNSVAYTWSGALIEINQGAVLMVSNPAGAAIFGTLQAQ